MGWARSLAAVGTVGLMKDGRFTRAFAVLSSPGKLWHKRHARTLRVL